MLRTLKVIPPTHDQQLAGMVGLNDIPTNVMEASNGRSESLGLPSIAITSDICNNPHMRWAIPVLIVMATASAWAQEGLSFAPLARQDLIVVGTSRSDFRFPWLDGWNERGHIEIIRTVKGNIGNTRSVPFSWEKAFRQMWCLTSSEWSGLVGKTGIWLLRKQGATYRADMFYGYFKSKYLDQVVELLAAEQ